MIFLKHSYTVLQIIADCKCGGDAGDDSTIFSGVNVNFNNKCHPSLSIFINTDRIIVIIAIVHKHF